MVSGGSDGDGDGDGGFGMFEYCDIVLMGACLWKCCDCGAC